MDRVTSAPETNESRPISGLSFLSLQRALVARGERPFRSDQVARWIYRSAVADFAEMRNLPKELRSWLADAYQFSSANLTTQLISADGDTTKAVLRLEDGSLVETVLLQYRQRSDGTGTNRTSVCVHSAHQD